MRLHTDQTFKALRLTAMATLLLLLALASSLANADEPSDDRPIIMCPTLALRVRPIKEQIKLHQETLPSDELGVYQLDNIFRELGRQLVLNVFRDEFGLPTRDESLFEPIDASSDHLFEVDVMLISGKSFKLIIRHKGKEVFSQKQQAQFAQGSGHRCSTMLDSKFKPNLIAAIEKLGYKQVDRTQRETNEFTPLPISIEQDLRSMNHLRQFSALRKLHRLIRQSGPTTARLCGLVRGYATLSQLTFSTLDSRNEVFAARTMLYERQMRVFSGHSIHAISTEAYSNVMLGYPNRAWGHCQKATARFAEKQIKPDDWLPLLADYIHYRDSKIEQVMQDKDSPLREIAALLRFRSGLQSVTNQTDYSKLHSGELALKAIPTCQWIYDRLAASAGVSPGHRWNALTPRAISKQLQEFLPNYDELPQDVENEIDQIIADGGFDLLSAANISNKLVAAAEQDKSEPSLALLGRNIEAWNVMHVVRSATFYREMIGVDPQPIVDDFEPVFENHPLSGFVRVAGLRRTAFKTHQEHRDKVNELLKDVEYKFPNSKSDSILIRNLHIHCHFGDGTPYLDAHTLSKAANTAPEHAICISAKKNLATAYWMKTISRRSPTRMATVFRDDFEHNKADFEQWVKDYPESPAMLLTAAKIYAEELNEPKKSKELYERYLSKSSDGTIIFELAKMQFHQTKSDDWIATLVRIFDTEDQGLQHSNAAAQLAATLMREGDFDLALEWAERANQSGSGNGMMILQQCLTGLGRLDEASELGRKNYARYPGATSAYSWYCWCAANQHEDLDKSWELLQETYKRLHTEENATASIEYNQAFFDLFNGDVDLAKAQYKKKMYATKSLRTGLTYAMMCDQENDSKNRDKTLKQIADTGKKKPSIHAELAKVLLKYFKTEKFDQASYDQTFKDYPDSVNLKDELDYWVIVAVLKHDGDQAIDSVKQHLTKKSLEINYTSIHVDILRHLLLVKLGEEPVYFTNLSRKQAWTRITPSEVMLKNKARLKKLRQEMAERARKNDFEYQRKLKKEAQKQDKALTE